MEKKKPVEVIRQSVDLRPNAIVKKIIRRLRIYEQYRDHTFYDSQALPVKQIWEQFVGQSDRENRIKELKYESPSESLILKTFLLPKLPCALLI